MNFSELREGKVYFLPVKVMSILPVQERVKISKKVDSLTGECITKEEVVEGYPFPPYVALWDGRCKYIGEDTYKHFMTAGEIAELMKRAKREKNKKRTKFHIMEEAKSFTDSGDAPNPRHTCRTCAHGSTYADGRSNWCKLREYPCCKSNTCAAWEAEGQKEVQLELF